MNGTSDPVFDLRGWFLSKKAKALAILSAATAAGDNIGMTTTELKALVILGVAYLLSQGMADILKGKKP